jgi:hypothetical protein
MTNRELTAYIWKRTGNLLLEAYIVITLLYFVLMGPTTTGITGPYRMGWYLLGGGTYPVANALWYLGSSIISFRLGLNLGLKVVEYLDTRK